MECRPFNIKVMLIAPGSVISNIAKNSTPNLSLPADSLYAPFVASILERQGISQTKAAMPTIVFAKRVTAKILKARPPVYMTLGGFAFSFTMFKWLPKTWVLSFLWNRFSKKA
jgi:1-acylglycerone phosphate reductase